MSNVAKKTNRSEKKRRGIIVVLSAFMLVVMLAFMALAIDVGFMELVRTELQTVADSAALAAAGELAHPDQAIINAKNYAALNKAGNPTVPVSVSTSDIVFGTWDSGARTFTPSNDQSGNAVKVTAHRNNTTGGNGLFFARILGRSSYDIQAEAIAMGNPRDICFVVDLSGSMNDDTEPGYSGTGAISGDYAAIRTQMMTDLFSDMNFGAYPGTQQSVGLPMGVTTYSALTSSTGPLSKNSWTYQGVTRTITSTYKILSGDSTSTRKTKAYRWMIDYQIASIMPNAKPTPLSSNTASFNYWSVYLDAVTGQSNSNQNIGYRTYVQFMMDKGRNESVTGSTFSQMVVGSPYCTYHSELVDGQSFQFPPREQPTHACRRSLIASIQEVKKKNQSIADVNQRDWVSIVTFDTVAGTVVYLPLTSNYDAAMQACTTLQAVYDQTSTATETGMISAFNLIKPSNEGGSGRLNTQKVVVLLTDGMPNLKTSANNTISNYITANPSDNFYSGSGNTNHNAALMQAAMMQAKHWKVYGVGIGLGSDNGFMDRIARMGETANGDGEAPHTTGDPSLYEIELRAIFKQIIDNPQVRLVQ